MTASRILHIGCLPFPSFQGTQAALRMMLEAGAEVGQDTHLLSYAGGTSGRAPETWAHHRLWDVPKVPSLRSGPSIGKVMLNAQMIPWTRWMVRRLRPRAIVAHNVEAAWVCRLAGLEALYFAHTRFDLELPTYFPGASPSGRVWAQRLGSMLDRGAAWRPCAAVSPELAHHLGGVYVPIPWPVPEPIAAAERDVGRQRWGIAASAKVALYVGNLDGYQGWEDVVDAAAEAGHELLLATKSDPGPLLQRASHRSLQVHLVALEPQGGEEQRRLLHAAADAVFLSRRAAGGMPIKLLDALARGVPTVATKMASAGLRAPGLVLTENDPTALARGVGSLTPDAGEHSRAWMRKAHSVQAYAAGLSEALGAGR